MADKITQLRAWLETEKLDAYLVPHADRFQSEYLPPEEERLAWLTGFAGSAGMAAILKEKAFLFTDGRYTLQAAKQLGGAYYEAVESPPISPIVHLEKHLASGAVIGFDPNLFTVAQIAMWRKAAAKTQWIMLAVNENPIDALWTDRPVSEIVVAQDHPLAFAGQSTQDKVATLLQKKEKAAGFVLISDPSLVCWLLNMRGQDVAHVPLVQSIVLMDKDGQITLLTDPAKITPELRQVWGNHVAVDHLDRLYDVLAKIDQPLQIDPSQCPYAIKEFCDDRGIAVIEANDPSLLLRACKNETEINGAIRAHETDAKSYADFLGWFRGRDFANETITELDIMDQLRAARMKHADCTDESFDTIAGYGPNGAIVHYHADAQSNLRLENGSLLLLDSGGQYRYGTTDITRVFAIGTPTAQMKTHYTAVLKGLLALSMARFPEGTTGSQLEALARAPIWAHGIDYAHGTGHGVGSYLSVHEGPQGLSPRGSMTALQPGMILSIEPGIYLTGEYGIRLENLVVVVEDKRPGDVKNMLAFKTLTKVPFEENLIDTDALTPDEQEFLKQFA